MKGRVMDLMAKGVVRHGTAWAFLVSGAAAVLWAAAVPQGVATQPIAPRSSTPVHAVARIYPADSLARLAVARDVFRVTRRPAALAYDPQRVFGTVEVQQAPKPALLLVGIVVGAEPSAVIEGFPGIEGARVVRIGDEVSGVRVMRIAADHVRLAGMDTVWVLRVREPWN